MKIERNRAWNKYTFTAEDKEDEKFLDKVNKKIDELEEENNALRENVNHRAWRCADLSEENEKLKEKQKILDKENCELIDENVKLKKELKEKNELLNNAARCSEQYRGKMISVMQELKMFLYKD